MNEPGMAWQGEGGGSPAAAGTQALPRPQTAPSPPFGGSLWSQLLATGSGLAVLGAIFYGLSRTGWIERIDSWVADLGTAAYAIFPGFYALCNVLLLPAGILSVGAGYLFGLWPGFFLALAGNLLGAAAAFGLSRLFLRDLVTRWIRRNPKLAAFDRAIGKDGWKLVFLTQLNPLAPTSLLNYVYGATRLDFRQTMLWTAIGQTPGLFLYAYLGWAGQGPWHQVVASGTAVDSASAAGSLGAAGGAWFWAGGLVLTVLLTLYLRAFAQRVLQDSMEPMESPE
jgi:uncharacterized membrane protein YdjX (TVP38/TMEM64 family)